MKKHFTYPSEDGITHIHAIEWIPKKEVKGILQISHGMVEYIDATMILPVIWHSMEFTWW